jgi:SAM-dependent methyltransferase
MLEKEELLAQINRDVPAGVDWRAGAQHYVARCFELMGRQNVERYALTKPLSLVGRDDPAPAIVENVQYLYNFANALALVRPRFGARVLDVACGGGWVSHFLSRMGYWTYGIDISADFIGLASERLAGDSTLHLSAEAAAARFKILDIEASPLPDHLRGTFDIVWMESCLHHFVDPVGALDHLSDALRPDGIVVLIEFENRAGPIKDEYLAVMREYDTLERPLSRAELEHALRLSGLTEHEFVGTVNGWFSPRDPAASAVADVLVGGASQMNLAICAKQAERLDEVFPFRHCGQTTPVMRRVSRRRWWQRLLA